MLTVTCKLLEYKAYSMKTPEGTLIPTGARRSHANATICRGNYTKKSPAGKQGIKPIANT